MKAFLLTTLLLTATSALAAEPNPEPAPEPTPSLIGMWELTSRACSSNAAINDGIKIGQDKLTFINKEDKTFEFRRDVDGCLTTIVGTYELDGQKATYTAATSQGCKDATPMPSTDKQAMFFAYLGVSEAVAVITDEKAALSCPQGDALILSLSKKEEGQP